MSIRYIDIHSHLNDKRYEADLPEVLSRMHEVNLASIVVGTDKQMSSRAIALSEEHAGLWATVGLHPTDNAKEQFDTTEYERMAAHDNVVAIGECGLDYYWPEHDNWLSGEEVEKERQRELFEKHIAVAKKVNKPLMIHGRPTKGSQDAYQDILSILKDHPSIRGNVHFFVGNVDIARQFLDIGFTMSFTGVLTFTHDYDEVVRFLPIERIMSETDAPYVAPKSMRGKRNEPSFVVETVKVIATIRGEDEEKVAAALVDNAERTFKINE